MDMQRVMNKKFKDIQGGLFAKVTKADVGEGAGKLMAQGYDFMTTRPLSSSKRARP